MYFMRSERGTVSIRKGVYSGDAFAELTVRCTHYMCGA